MFKIYLLNASNYPTEIYNDLNVFDPIVLEPELEYNGENGILIGKLSFKLRNPDFEYDFRLLHNTVIVTQVISGVETVIFRGRPLLRDDDNYNDQDYTFEGILAGLNDTLQAPSNKEIGGRLYEHFVTIIDWHNNQVRSISNNRLIDYSKISRTDSKSHMYTISGRDPIHIFIEKMVKYTRFRASTMDHIKTQYVDAHGGYFYLEDEPLTYDSSGCVVLHNYLKYVDIYNPDQTHINRQQIEFGKNLISIKRSASADDFATVLVPLGKQLTDIDKAWPYYQSVENNKLRKIVSSPDDAEIINYNSTGASIDSETGKEYRNLSSAYVLPRDVDVNPGEVFYLTTYLEGVSTDKGIATYAILDRATGSKVYAMGTSVRNSKESGGAVTVKNVVLKDERIEIPDIEEQGVDLKLRTAYMISANDPNGGFILKKFNKNYQEDNVTIMSADPLATGTIRKTGQYPVGRDVYPDATDTPTAPETYEQSKRIVNKDLFDVFGSIERSIEFSDYGIDEVNDIVGVASKELEKMGEDLEIEIEAADLSYIDDSQEPFRPYDLVPVKSDPHGIDMMLPIVKMTLPLADPAAATYTLQNDIHLSQDNKKYISQMVSSPGANQRPTTTVYISSGSSGGGGGGSGDAENAVLYVMQDLLESQKAQARANIGAVAAVAGKGLSSNDYTIAEKNKLAGIETGAEKNVQSDWNQTDTTADDFIKNKPTIPSAQIQADWNQTNISAKDFIKNKPTIPDAQIQADWNQTDTSADDFIKNKPTIPAAQIQADWNQTDTSADDFIKNKPSIGDAVLYSQQSLTDAQKLQARYNIYAGKSTVSYDPDYGTLSIETAGESAKTYFLSKFRRHTFYYNADTGNTDLVYSEIASFVQQGYDVQCKITCGSSDFYAALRRDRSNSQAGPDMYVFDVHTYQEEDDALWWMSVRVYADDTIEFYEGDYDPKPVKYHNVTLNADGSVRTAASSLVYSAIQSRLSAWQLSDYLLVTWGSTKFLAKAVEDINGIKFITDCEHDAMQRHMVFTLNTSNVLTTAIETYSLRPVVVWEVQDATQGLSALNTNITANLAWQLTNLDLTPFKRIKIYSRAGRKTGALAADSSITPASIIEMSLDDRAKETVSQNVFIGSSVVQNPNDPNRLGILTCAVSADKTKFAVVRSTTLYGTAATSNTDAYTYVFKIEGCYD